MTMDREEVRRLARLAQLEYPRVQDAEGRWREPDALLIDDATLDALARELTQILAHVRQLEEVDVEGVEPTAHGVPLPTRLRADEPGEALPTDLALDQAPARLADGFAVPKVLE
jgi:aspartyl-tRNA(Asn)/glutamyl-tRNA(Gln) amidotransferase subunit C